MYRGLGDVYSDWAAQVQAAGGVATSLPHAPGNVPAAAFPFWVTPAAAIVANPSTWQDVGADGTLYYQAPAAVVQFAGATGLVQQSSIDAAAAKNPDAGVPDWLQQLQAAAKTIAIVAGVGLGVLVLLPIVRDRMRKS
jgi:hypothetical protein